MMGPASVCTTAKLKQAGKEMGKVDTLQDEFQMGKPIRWPNYGIMSLDTQKNLHYQHTIVLTPELLFTIGWEVNTIAQ